uniref:Uncharacterized protein n=1 Tax=Siphoviridae sp. ctJyX12 TaxID=2827840 RepID=A0A8S5SPS2_9CAUD|nr:MAG TPA: hypothetical protein [Siphoviridae sp. ctJyX12]DAK36383.1 MAG TPA: hypothetical protein [Caudoviricetes sp.]
MTFRTGPVGGWNGCPDPRIVAGLTRGEGHGARLTMGAVSSSSSYTLKDCHYGPSPLRWERRPRRLNARLIGCRARIRRREPTNRPSTLRRAPKG